MVPTTRSRLAALYGALFALGVGFSGGNSVEARDDTPRPPASGQIKSPQHSRVVTRTQQINQTQVRRVPIRVSRPSRGQRWAGPPRGSHRIMARAFPLRARWQTDPRTYAVYSIYNNDVWYLDPTTGWAYTVDRWGVVYSADPRQGFVYSLGELSRWTADLLYFFDYFSYDRGYWQPNYYARYWGAWNAPRGLFFDYGGAYDCLWGYDYYFASQTFVVQTVTFSRTYVREVHREVVYEREHPQHLRQQVQAVGVAAMNATPPAQISPQSVTTAATVEVANVGIGENAVVVPVVDGESAAIVEPLAVDATMPAGATDLGTVPVDPLPPAETATTTPESVDVSATDTIADDASAGGDVDTVTGTPPTSEMDGENATATLPGVGDDPTLAQPEADPLQPSLTPDVDAATVGATSPEDSAISTTGGVTDDQSPIGDDGSLPQAYVAPPDAESASEAGFQTYAPPAMNEAPGSIAEPLQQLDEQQGEAPQAYEPPAQSYEPPPQQSYDQQYEAPQAYEPPAQSYEPPPQQSYDQQYEAPQAYEPPAQSYEPPPQQSYDQQYEAPQAYEPPAQSYEPPAPAYEAPQPVFEQPAPAFEPPPQMSAPPPPTQEEAPAASEEEQASE